MADPLDKTRLESLEQRIEAAKSASAPRPAVEDHHSQAQLAWRMVMELVAGLGIGLAMGYGLDSLFGTMPVFLIVMTFVGFAAGVRTMLRSAQEVQAEQERAEQAQDEDKKEQD